MTPGTSIGASAAGMVLERAQGFRREADTAEASLLAEVLAWCELHTTDDRDDAATWGDTPVLLGGVGCPWVREFTITELATALHLSASAGRELVSDVLELAFRLPRLWGNVQSGRVQEWRARRVARQTQHLSLEAARFVDSQVAEFAHRMGSAAVERLVEDAVGRFMPELARRQREEAADRRHFDIDHAQVSFDGTCRVDGELDLADALDLDAALAHVAGELKNLGNELPLDQRRALAAGELARAQYSFLHSFDQTPAQFRWSSALEERVGVSRPEPRLDTPPPLADQDPGRFGRRDMTLYVHVSADALTGAGVDPTIDPDAVVTVEGHGNPLVRLETLREWLHIAGNVSVSIRPVIDLNANLTSNGRFATPLQREQITLRDRTCAAPYCERPARRLDLDHIQAWHDPDDTGPPGQTNSANLGALCRHHHRAKTHTGWDYEQLTPGVFLWSSPRGTQVPDLRRPDR